MKQDVLMRIGEMEPQFSKGQKRIAAYLTEHFEEAAYMTAARLGATVGVSESTVVRFASEIGYPGYPELQGALHELLRNRLTNVQRMRVGKAQIQQDAILSRVLTRDMDCIRRTMDEMSTDAFAAAADCLCEGNQIHILGVRSAGGLAQFMSFYLNHIFPNVRLVDTTSRSEMFERLMRIGKGDVFIGLTFPRYSKRTYQAASFAKQNGASVIVITDSIHAPIAKTADHLLLASSDMQSFVDSLVAPLSVINALLVAVGLKRQADLAANYERLEKIWAEYEVYQSGDAEPI